MVVETRMDSRYGFGWRRRLCLGCGADFGTYEIPDANVNLAAYEPIKPDGKLERR
jgi:transcriptional regulator NrdR family protein